jgi:peptide/nickel transport system substrate-binding protein
MAVVVIVIVVVAAVVVAFVATSSTAPTQSTSSSLTSMPTQSTNTTLNIDDTYWIGWQLGIFEPAWWEFVVYQPIVTMNVSAEQLNARIQILPALATNWTVSPDGKTYTFNLNPSITFSDGVPVTAYDVWSVFYMQYYMFGNSSTFLYGVPIFNFNNVKFGPATLSMMGQSINSPSPALMSIMKDSSWPVYVTDQNTIVFQMSVPYADFMNLLVAPYLLVFDATYVMQHGGPGAPGSPNSYFLLNPPPGTGPYVFSSVISNTRDVFAQNPNYWDKSLTAAEIAANPTLDPGHFTTIVVNNVPDGNVRYLDLTQGRAQMAQIGGSNFQGLLNSKNPLYNWVETGPYPGQSVFMSLNVHRTPTDNKYVRLAIVHAINVTQLIDQAAYGLGTPYVGPECPVYGSFYNPTNLSPYAYNVTEAEADLALAGYPMGKGLPTIPLNIDSALPWEQTAAELIQQDLSVIGITVNIVVTSYDNFLATYFQPYSTLMNDTAVMAMAFDTGYAYSPDYIGVTDYLGQFTTNSSSYANFALYSSDTTNRALQDFLSSNNETLLHQDMAASYQQVYQDVPYDWLFTVKLPQVSGSDVYNTQVIHSYWIDPELYGSTTLPLLNTIG